MNYIERSIGKICLKDLSSFPVLTLTGPRQSGKSTLLRHLLPDWTYVNLEDPTASDFAMQDPRGFLMTYPQKVIFDEIQRVPPLLSQIQVKVDKHRIPGQFAVTGSNNLLLLESVSQSLAGRTAVRHLLPFSLSEIKSKQISDLDEMLFRGGYPLVVADPKAGASWIDSYIQTYVERDVRLVKNITDLSTFRRFLLLCAGRAAQLLDLSGLGGDTGISHNTAKDWIGVLETGFIVFRLQPYFRNFSKRVIKNSKLYFYDTGILCRLLNIRSSQELRNHPFRGHVFENWCIVETMKAFYNRGLTPSVYFWRDQSIEVDLLAEWSATKMSAYECKSGATPVAEFLQPALKFKQFAKELDVDVGVIYGGDVTQKRSDGDFIAWQEFSEMVAASDRF